MGKIRALECNIFVRSWLNIMDVKNHFQKYVFNQMKALKAVVRLLGHWAKCSQLMSSCLMTSEFSSTMSIGCYCADRF